MLLRFQNFIASTSIISFFYLLYTKHTYFKWYFDVTHSLTFFSYSSTFTTFQVFKVMFFVYIFALWLLYFLEKNPKKWKSILALQALEKIFSNPLKTYTEWLPKEEKIWLLTIFVKVFFIPLMLSWLSGHTSNMLSNMTYVVQNYNLIFTDFISIFKSHLFWFLFQVILFLDVFFFTIWYLVELPVLKNQIRSTDPTLFWWVVALMCYPPFNTATWSILTWHSSDFPMFENVFLLVLFNILILILMGIYTWASVALNFKASNLTHRWIISHWPYKYIRHPAYICKNAAWWIWAIPAFVFAFNSWVFQFIIAFIWVAWWSFIYFLRAMTEESHLRSVDWEYDEYMKKVKYRFIPWLF